MDQTNLRVVYNDPQHGLCLLTPAPSCLQKYSLEEIADKDVPAGLPYKIVHKDELPDLWFIEAWEIDDAELTDGEGADRTEFLEQR